MIKSLLLLAANSADTAMPMAEVVPDSAASGLLMWVLWAGAVALIIGMGLCLFRVIRGPHLADRVLAADTLALQVVGLVLLLSTSLESTVFFDVALVLAIIGFASTVAFSQYIYAKAQRGEEVV